MKGPVVITGGGTGGHIFPMQAVAQQLETLGIGAMNMRYVGSRRGQETRILGDSPIALTALPGRGIKRSLAPRALVDNLRALWGLLEALSIAMLKVVTWRPSVVVSVGGYASFAMSFAAVIWRRPLVVIDLDSTPGMANRLLGRFARVRCTGFATSEVRTVFTGVPLRDEIRTVDRSDTARRQARESFNPPVELERKVVVVMTGSLGATSVNRAVSELARLWNTRQDLTLIHVTGRRDYEEVLQRQPPHDALDYRVVEFADMSQLWVLCDLAICRAGATTLAELTALGIASIVVPLPGAPGDHQAKNARALASAGAAKVLDDRHCSAGALGALVDDVLANSLETMGEAALALGRPEASRDIARVVAEVGGWL